MEKSNNTNNEKDVHNMSENIFLHFIKPEYLPVGSTFEPVENISDLKDASYKEISINDVLDYLDHNQVSNILDSIYKKLSVGGSLIIQSSDLYMLSSAVCFNDIDISIVKSVLFNGKKNMYIMHEIEQELINRDLIIVEKKYLNIFEYFIRANKK
jgi:hypothetical protein